MLNLEQVQSYETMAVDWETTEVSLLRDMVVVGQFMRYAGMLARRGLICNTFGNIAVRVPAPGHEHGVIYTKSRGVSLEECEPDDVVVTDILSNRLLWGRRPPSNGHQMSREILRIRPSEAAVIHTHANEVCAFFSAWDGGPFKNVANDTALVLGAAPVVLPPKLNLEADSSRLEECLGAATCLVMPNHGFVTVGSTLSEAYNRHTAFVAEIQRQILMHSLGRDKECYLDQDEVDRLYTLGDRVIYGI